MSPFRPIRMLFAAAMALSLVVPAFCAPSLMAECMAADGGELLSGTCCCRTECACGTACSADDRPAKENGKGSPTSEASGRDGGKFPSSVCPLALQTGSQRFSGFDFSHSAAGLRLQTLIALHICLQV